MNISISVIIVAYKSQSFIACCLSSINSASTEFDIEIIVIDNDSGDGLKEFIKEEFSNVRFVQNEKNIGFGAACNQGALIANGKYLVFLNPDTIVSRTFFSSLSDAIKELPDAGIISGMLYDARGNVLPESARQLPSILSATKKALGIKNGTAQYYKPINSDPYQEIPIVAGAAMMIEKFKFEKLKGFDERFFMYAEDVDLSYRSSQSIYKNYLVKSAAVIHLKGESTSKEGWQYNRYFYSTMAAFVKKYVGSLYLKLDFYLVTCVTILLGIFSFGYHVFKRSKSVIGDFVTGFVICFAVQFLWSFMRYGIWDYYGILDHWGSYFLYVSIWIAAMLIGGAYWRDSSREQALKCLSFGVLLSLVVYSLVPLEWRFSRGVILISGIVMLIIKYLKDGFSNYNSNGRILYIENNRTTKEPFDISAILNSVHNVQYIESTKLNDIEITNNDHVLLRTDDTYDPVDVILKMGNELKYSFVNAGTRQIISSHIPGIRGDRFDHLSQHNLSKKTFIFQKRLIDIIASIIFLIPLMVFQAILTQKVKLEKWKRVWNGLDTIVGYNISELNQEVVELKNYMITCYADHDNKAIRKDKIVHYSLHYTIFDDCYLIMMNWSRLLRVYTYGRLEK